MRAIPALAALTGEAPHELSRRVEATAPGMLALVWIRGRWRVEIGPDPWATAP